MRHQSDSNSELFELCVSFLCYIILFNKGSPLERPHHCLDPIIQQVPTSVFFFLLTTFSLNFTCWSFYVVA